LSIIWGKNSSHVVKKHQNSSHVVNVVRMLFFNFQLKIVRMLSKKGKIVRMLFLFFD